MTPWTAACQASLSFTTSQCLLKFMFFEPMKPSNCLILCCYLLLLPSILPSIRVFSNESAVPFRRPKYWSFSFSISINITDVKNKKYHSDQVVKCLKYKMGKKITDGKLECEKCEQMWEKLVENVVGTFFPKNSVAQKASYPKHRSANKKKVMSKLVLLSM